MDLHEDVAVVDWGREVVVKLTGGRRDEMSFDKKSSDEQLNVLENSLQL